MAPPRPNGWRWCFQSENRQCINFYGHSKYRRTSKFQYWLRSYALLLNGWILPIGGASAVEGLRSTGLLCLVCILNYDRGMDSGHFCLFCFLYFYFVSMRGGAEVVKSSANTDIRLNSFLERFYGVYFPPNCALYFLIPPTR